MTRSMYRVLPLAILLSACGGGSGDAGTGAPPPSASFPITSENAQDATAKSWHAANSSTAYANLAGTGGFVAASQGDFTKVAGATVGQLPALLGKIPFGPETVACPGTGTVTYSGDIADITTLTAGDVINADYDACGDGSGAIIDGELTMTIDAFNGDLAGGVYELALSIELTNFQASFGNLFETANGAITIALNTMATPIIVSSVSGDGLAVDTNVASTSLTNFLTQQTIDTGSVTPLYSLLASGTLDNSLLPGSVSYSTPVEFERLGDDYPYAGTLLVTGENSSARLVVIDNTNVRIDIDADGNGEFESSIETTWSELDD